MRHAHVPEAEWQALIDAGNTDALVAAHLDMWLCGRWSFVLAVVKLALAQVKANAELTKQLVSVIERTPVAIVRPSEEQGTP